jgi:hypothetical protein
MHRCNQGQRALIQRAGHIRARCQRPHASRGELSSTFKSKHKQSHAKQHQARSFTRAPCAIPIQLKIAIRSDKEPQRLLTSSASRCFGGMSASLPVTRLNKLLADCFSTWKLFIPPVIDQPQPPQSLVLFRKRRWQAASAALHWISPPELKFGLQQASPHSDTHLVFTDLRRRDNELERFSFTLLV